MNEKTLASGAFVALLLVAAGVWYVRQAVPKLGSAINPLSPENVAYSSVNALGAVIADDKNFSLGARTWEWLNPDAVAAENRAIGASSIDGATMIDTNVARASALPSSGYENSPASFEVIDAGSGYENSPAAFATPAPTPSYAWWPYGR